MHPINRAAAISAAIFALGSRAGAPRDPHTPPASRPSAGTLSEDSPGGGPVGLSSVCPPGSIPDGALCVSLPNGDDEGGDELMAMAGAHFDKRGRYDTYDQIPRRPDRTAEYAAYRYPIPIAAGTRLTMSGYDLDLPDKDQRRGRRFSHVGHGGIDLPGERGTEVRVLALEHQEGDAAVLFAGPLFGTTVITRHTLREGGRLRDYLVLYGHLDRAAVETGRSRPPLGEPAGPKRVPEGDLLGYVGDTGSQGVVHLHLEVRRVREGVDLAKVQPQRLVANEISVVCDPRNVLPLK